jgi:hypothetical protein
VGGVNIQIVYYFGHSFREEEKSMIHSFTVTFGAIYLTDGILHLKVTGGGQLSTTKWVWDVVGVKDSINISCKIPTGKVLAHLGDTQFHSYFWSNIFDRHGY